MLPILPITINPTINLFTEINNRQTLGQLDRMDLGFFYIELFFLILTISVTALVYFSNRRKDKKVAKEKAKEGLCVMLLLVVSVLFTYFTTINPTISKYNQINNLPLETVFSSYRINKVEGTKNNETQFKVYLKKLKNNESIEKSMYKYLDDSVVINVSKVNKDSFNITLDNDQVVTIKKKDAEQIFNTLNKIKAKESEN